MQDITELTKLVEGWGFDRGILGGSNPTKQYKKLMSEVAELGLAIGADDTEEIKDGIGDSMVVLILLARLCGTDARACLQAAYDVISQRTGKMVDGTFVKQEDLDKQNG